MSVDGWIRRAALLAIPVLAGVLYLARSRAPEASGGQSEAAAASGSEREPGRAPAAGEPRAGARGESWAEQSVDTTQPGSLGQALAERGEAALGAKSASDPGKRDEPKPTKREPPEEPLPVATSAAELPLAATTSHRSAPSRAPLRERSSPASSACGGVEVRLITASDDPAWAFASLAPGLGEQAVLRRVGERIGNWQVDQIEWDRVWLRGAGSRCMVGMHFGAREAEEAVPRGRSVGVPSRRPEEKPWRVPGEIANAIDKLGQTEFSIEKAIVPAVFDQAGALLAGLSIEPVKRGEDVVGFELGEIKTDSLLERLGVETGDVVLAVDGEPVQSLETLARLLDDARNRDRLVARLERNGEAFELRLVAR